MSEIQALLEQGARPRGDYGRQLADALLCAAGNGEGHQEDRALARLLLPGLYATVPPDAVDQRFAFLIDLVWHEDPVTRADARITATLLASSEVSVQPSGRPANYEGKHRGT